MITELTHNKIINDTVTDKFVASVEADLVPVVEAKYGSSAVLIQMYEDYLSDGFLKDGRWYYPLTVLTGDGPQTLWISWSVDKKRFKGAVPYSYVGEGPIDFECVGEVPEGFAEKLEGRSIYAPSGYLKLKIHSASEDPLFLAGKYSQTFIDEMARQLTEKISRALGVSGLGDAPLSLQMIFAPDTYMEHTSENVTYRRLRFTDKTSAPRDFWVKWTRINSASAYSVSDTPETDGIVFELGEDVSKKIREKEYRFLIRQSADKFEDAMNRKTVTEWRELVKRSLKRGELIKLEITPEKEYAEEKLEREYSEAKTETVYTEAKTETETFNAAEDHLAALLASMAEPSVEPVEEVPAPTEEKDELHDLLRRFLGESVEEEVAPVKEEAAPVEEETDTAPSDSEGVKAEEEETEIVSSEPVADAPEEIETSASDELKEQLIRAEIEAKIRLEYETKERQRAEEETRRLIEEQERLRRENERLLQETRRIQEQKEREDRERQEREDRLRAELESKAREEAREKERLQEAALLAIEEKRRLENEKVQAARQAELEAKKEEEERLLRLENERKERERRIEEERTRLEAEAREREERERAEVEAREQSRKSGYNFVSKKVLFFFRVSVDNSITEPMERIIRETLERLGKTNVPINIRASIVDEKTVCLDFVKIPAEEEELFIEIVQSLGRGNIGISKARVE